MITGTNSTAIWNLIRGHTQQSAPNELHSQAGTHWSCSGQLLQCPAECAHGRHGWGWYCVGEVTWLSFEWSSRSSPKDRVRERTSRTGHLLARENVAPFGREETWGGARFWLARRLFSNLTIGAFSWLIPSYICLGATDLAWESHSSFQSGILMKSLNLEVLE